MSSSSSISISVLCSWVMKVMDYFKIPPILSKTVCNHILHSYMFYYSGGYYYLTVTPYANMCSTAGCTQALLSRNFDSVAAQRSWEGFRNSKAQGKPALLLSNFEAFP